MRSARRRFLTRAEEATRPRGLPVTRITKRGFGEDLLACLLCGRAFRTISWSHLVHVHSFDREHPIETYKGRFGLKRAFSAATIQAMKSSLAAHFDRQGRGWTTIRVRGAILKDWKDGQDISWRSVFRRGKLLAWAARRLFGSWERAVRSCGIPYQDVRAQHEWTTKELMETLRRWDHEGLPIHYQAVRARSNALLQAALARWGTWEKTVLAAGLAPDRSRIRRHWTSEKVKKSILKLGRWLPVRQAKRLDSGLHRAAVLHFGTWRSAVLSAGLPYPEHHSPRKWPRERVLDEIRRRADQGMSLRATDIQRHCRGLGAAGQREFGTWPLAVRAAGVPYPKRQGGWKWPRERILRTIRDRVRHGLPVTDRVMKAAFGGLWWAGRREFGTWLNAVAAAEASRPSRRS